jgi:hypothetical protein
MTKKVKPEVKFEEPKKESKEKVVKKAKLITFKVFVKTDKESEQIQKLLFKKAIRWSGEELDYILPLHTPCFIIARGAILTYIKCATNNIPTYTIGDINKL